MTVIEIAVFTAVLSGAAPIVCHLEDSGLTRCSNGYVAEALSAGSVRFGNGIMVSLEGGELAFSNGLKSWIDAGGSIRFSNGIGVRRAGDGSYAFSNGLVCRSELPQLVKCVRPRAMTASGS
jgi:hypothetical protein